VEYKNDLEKAYQFYKLPLVKKDLEWLFYQGYDAMASERLKRRNGDPEKIDPKSIPAIDRTVDMCPVDSLNAVGLDRFVEIADEKLAGNVRIENGGEFRRIVDGDQVIEISQITHEDHDADMGEIAEDFEPVTSGENIEIDWEEYD